MAHKWTSTPNLAEVPVGAVVAGVDETGVNVYVGRAQNDGAWVVVTISPARHMAFGQTSQGRNFQSRQAEFLTGTVYYWSDMNGCPEKLPDQVVATKTGVYVGRHVLEDNVQTFVGEIHRSKGKIYCWGISPRPEYQFLCLKFNVSIVGDGIWQEAKINGAVPVEAVQAGTHKDGNPLYVARFWHEGALLPGVIVGSKTNPAQVVAINAHWDDETISTNRRMILVGTGYSWQSSKDGHVPKGALQAGFTADGEPLYVGRAIINGFVVLGKIRPSHKVLYIAWLRRLTKFSDYEVLLMPLPADGYSDDLYRWVSATNEKPVPENVVFVGLDADDSEIYAGRLMHSGTMLPANVIPQRRLAIASDDGKKVVSWNYEFLVGNGFAWIDSSNGRVPQNAIKMLTSENQESVYIGRVQNSKSLMVGRVSPTKSCLLSPREENEHHYWHYQVLVKLTKDTQGINDQRWVAMDGTRDNSAPFNAVPYTDDASSKFVGRLFYKGEMLPAEVSSNFKIAMAIYEGRTIISTKFEVLTGTTWSWTQASNGEIPFGAIASGKTMHGELLFIGRVKVEDLVRFGKVHPFQSFCFVLCHCQKGTNEIDRYRDYEVLVQHKSTSNAVSMVGTETTRKCCPCRKNEATMAVMPCGNLCLCYQCSQNPLMDKCPICRGPKMKCIRIFQT